VRDAQTHAWADACLYRVTTTAEDDDEGTAADATWVVVTGSATQRQVTGWWGQQYKEGRRNRNDLQPTRLDCYLEIVGHVSAVFDEARFAGTRPAAQSILDASSSPNMSEEQLTLDRQLLAAWLNMSHGSIGWHDLVDTDRDRQVDTRFLDYIQAAESARLDPTSSREVLLRYATTLERVNEGRA
jgi:hypothetical protein